MENRHATANSDHIEKHGCPEWALHYKIMANGEVKPCMSSLKQPADPALAKELAKVLLKDRQLRLSGISYRS